MGKVCETFILVEFCDVLAELHPHPGVDSATGKRAVGEHGTAHAGHGEYAQ
jgi:hypothetical protein